MNIDELFKTIDLARHDLSLLLVGPKPSFLQWLDVYSKRKGLGRYKLNVKEEDAVIVIPKIDRFTEPGSFEYFVSTLKPSLLRGELSRVGATPEEFGHPVTRETFDVFFDLEVRAFVFLVTDYRTLKF